MIYFWVGRQRGKGNDVKASVHFTKLQHEANNPNVHTFKQKKFSNSVSNIILMLMLMPWIGYLQGVLVDFRTNALNESLN